MRNTIRKVDSAWTAGVIDADGCIFLRKVYPEGIMCYSLAVTVSQSGTEKPNLIKRLEKLWGGSTTGKREDKRRDYNRKPVWRWQIVSAGAEKMLREIKPFSIGKKNQVVIALEYRKKALGKGKKQVQEMYYHKLRDSKHSTSA